MFYILQLILQLESHQTKTNDEYMTLVNRLYCEVFCKTTEICSAKILKGVMKITQKSLQKYWNVFCRNSEMCFAKMLKCVLQKYLHVASNNTEKYSGILRDVPQNCWGELYILTKNEQLCKKSETWSFSC